MNKCLWTPSKSRIEQSNIAKFIGYLNENSAYTSKEVNYQALHDWSINHKELFWKALGQFSNIKGELGDLVLKNGEQKQLMYGNYRGFDRRAFFDALVLANSNIIVPENIYSYKIQRPSWAKRIRKRLGLD